MVNRLLIVKQLRRQSVAQVVLFSLFTLGIYCYFWLVRNTLILQKAGLASSIGKPFMQFSLGTLVCYLCFSLLELSHYPEPELWLSQLSFLFYLLTSTLWLIWTFLVRRCVNQLLAEHQLYQFRINIIWLVLFNVFYLQYKINQIQSYLDQHQGQLQPPSTQPPGHFLA